MMRDCAVRAIEGIHASGKTTLTHASAARYRERGIHVASVEESARRGPFIEKIVVHGRGRFDLETEVLSVTVTDGALVRAEPEAAAEHRHGFGEHLGRGSPMTGSPSQWPGSNANPMRVCVLPGFRW
jgi:hypothetical protein